MQRYSQHSLIILYLQNRNTGDYFFIFCSMQGLFSQQVIISIPKLLVCHRLLKYILYETRKMHFQDIFVGRNLNYYIDRIDCNQNLKDAINNGIRRNYDEMQQFFSLQEKCVENRTMDQITNFCVTCYSSSFARPISNITFK